MQWIADYRGQHARIRRPVEGLPVAAAAGAFRDFVRPIAARRRTALDRRAAGTRLRDQTIRIAGRIDRIDTGRVAGAGGVQRAGLQDRRLGAIQRRGGRARDCAATAPVRHGRGRGRSSADRDCVPWQAGYWYLADGGFRPKQALRMYHAAGGGLEPDERWETAARAGARDGRRAGPRHEGRAVPRVQRRCRLHRPLPVCLPSAASTRSVPWRRHGSRRSTTD